MHPHLQKVPKLVQQGLIKAQAFARKAQQYVRPRLIDTQATVRPYLVKAQENARPYLDKTRPYLHRALNQAKIVTRKANNKGLLTPLIVAVVFGLVYGISLANAGGGAPQANAATKPAYPGKQAAVVQQNHPLTPPYKAPPPVPVTPPVVHHHYHHHAAVVAPPAPPVQPAKTVAPPPPPPPPPPPRRHYICDSVTPSNCPSWTYAVASYVNGLGGESAAQAEFPNAYQIPIDARGTMPDESKALDVEPGAAPVSSVRSWASERNRLGYWAVVYCGKDDIPAVTQELAGLHYHLWIPNITGSSTDSSWPGADAVQFGWWPSVSNPQWDESWTWMSMGQMFGHF